MVLPVTQPQTQSGLNLKNFLTDHTPKEWYGYHNPDVCIIITNYMYIPS